MTTQQQNKIKNYLSNPKIKAVGQQIQFTPHQVQEYIKCAQDEVYFIENYVKIKNIDGGDMDFILHDYQKDMIDVYKNNRFCITKCPRQVGKSVTIVGGYMLHYILFNRMKDIGILAHKAETARELLGRLKFAYEQLPMWLQQGVVTWNKGSIELENGCTVLAASTSSSAVRGRAFAMAFLDEFAFVPDNIAEEFFKSTYPTISSGLTSKLIIVSTPHGMNLFYKLWTDAEKKKNSFVPFEIHWSQVPGRDVKWKEETIKNTSQEQFDEEHECHFVGSTNTLISGRKLRSMVYDDPIKKTENGVHIYKLPEKDRLYNMCVDVSEGLGLDASAFTVIDITEYPYQLVAKFKNNKISPILFPSIIEQVAKQYNMASVLVEINSVGGQISDILYHDLEYENMLMTVAKNKKMTEVSGGFSKSVHRGIKTSLQSKQIGCATLKTLIEDDKLIVPDFDIISELSSFIVNGKTFEAEIGRTDDLAMCLVHFGWLVNQQYFKEGVNHNITTRMMEEHEEMLMADIMPIYFPQEPLDVNKIIGTQLETKNW